MYTYLARASNSSPKSMVPMIVSRITDREIPAFFRYPTNPRDDAVTHSQIPCLKVSFTAFARLSPHMILRSAGEKSAFFSS